MSVGAVGGVGSAGASQGAGAVTPASGAASAGDQGTKGGASGPVGGASEGSDSTPAWPADYDKSSRGMSTADFLTLSQRSQSTNEAQSLVDPEALKKIMMIKMIMEILKALTDDNNSGGNNLGIA